MSFQNHFTFGIRESDLDEAKEQFYNHQDSLQRTFDYIIHDEDGVAYSNHFGAYSILVTFIKLILLFLDIYPLWAFCITNGILWLSAALVILFCLQTDDKRKFCLLILILINPAFFYLDWVHTEIFIFSFEIMGLVFLYNKQYALSITALSVASMQNLGVLPFAAVVGLDYIMDCLDRYKKNNCEYSLLGFVKSDWKKIGSYIVFYIPAFIPIITTYFKFGTYNLVAEVAMEDKYLLHKAIDYLFDWNIGIFPYEPVILICFIFFVIVGIKNLSRTAFLNLAGVGGMLFVIAHQLQINSGMQEIMRYCVWIIPILIFYVVMNWPLSEKQEKKQLVFASITQAVFTGLLIGYCVWGGGGYTNGQFAPWTKLILDKIPYLYNPSHGIFYSRVIGGESYDSPQPVVYSNQDGYVRKILLSKEAEKKFYTDDWIILSDDEGKVIDKKGLSAIKIDEGDYTYINTTGNVKCGYSYNLGDTIYFYSDQYNAGNYVFKGLSFQEEWGSWTDGESLQMKRLWIKEDAKFLRVNIDVASTFYQLQNVLISINGENVYTQKISGDQDIDFVFEKPENNMIDMTINLPDSIAPSEVMESKDDRRLGLGLLTMKFTEAN